MRRRSALLLLALALARPAFPQSGTWPTAVEDLALEPLAGDWHEVATYGSWSHRRCTSETRFHWAVRDARTIDVRSACNSGAGEEVRTGRLRAPTGAHRGRLAARFAPAFFAWLPAVWSDHWVLAVGERRAWLLIGDRRRSRLSVLSRYAALDEASFAQALRQARVQGFDVDRLVAVQRPNGGPASTRTVDGSWSERTHLGGARGCGLRRRLFGGAHTPPLVPDWDGRGSGLTAEAGTAQRGVAGSEGSSETLISGSRAPASRTSCLQTRRVRSSEANPHERAF